MCECSSINPCPTLNQYIELFETGKKIENERYNIIFKKLFSDRTTSKEFFDKKMKAVKFLLERDKKYDIGSLDPRAADIVARIHSDMVKDMSNEGWNNKIYDAILIFIENYKSNPIIRELASYFSDLNSDSDLSRLPEQSKAYYSYYYKCFRDILISAIELDEDAYEEFLQRKAEISKNREKINSDAEKRVKDRLANVIKMVRSEYQEKGLEITEEELIAEVIRRVD